ncbi:LPS export ABC transporter permease LptF [Aliiruegeria lutimaris]|uniref:Lipopolysaccharide export system permease protein n=1 Tax=Aliiruegeria lutimaris TaxID=571298 RepID=A0A1G8TTS0_9RHOB|nr:LPS export ABC transporter permease LptF [Aliiruegeria lutimaris]SDJ44335.1 lipopolysaccharide export system permease protein [Aliiruegeria lutimaris]
MRRFDRYFTYQLMVLFGFFSLVLVSVYWINRAVILFDQILSDGQSAGTFFTLTLYTLPNVVRMVLPISAFVASVYVTNRLTTESELVITQAVGMSPWRMARPVFIFGLFASLLMAILVHFLVPTSRIQMAEQMQELEADIAAQMLTEGRFLHPARGITFYIRSIERDGEMRDVYLSDARTKGTRTDYLAPKAYLVQDESGPKLVMLGGAAHTFDVQNRRLAITTFDSFTYNVGALMTNSGRSKRDLREFDTLTLFNPTEEDLDSARGDRARFLYEGHLRIAQPFNPLIVTLMGFSALMLGGFSRFGVWPQIGLAVALIILLQAAENVTADIARRDATLWPLVYLPSALGVVATSTMLWISSRPPLLKRAKRPEATA